MAHQFEHDVNTILLGKLGILLNLWLVLMHSGLNNAGMLAYRDVKCHTDSSVLYN